MKVNKTNALRILDSLNINYTMKEYDPKKAISGVEVANYFNISPSLIYKTLVAEGKSKANYVFIIAADKELDLKKAAKASNEKSIEMIKSKELLPLTGYVHGGCSPIGMKKSLKTYIDIDAIELENIIISAGKIGLQIELELSELEKVISFDLVDLTKE